MTEFLELTPKLSYDDNSSFTLPGNDHSFPPFQRIFKDSMLLQFVNVFLQALVFRSHDLLQEEITITLYNMAAVDFDSFYSVFLPQFLGGCEGLTDSQKTELGNNFTPDKVVTKNDYEETEWVISRDESKNFSDGVDPNLDSENAGLFLQESQNKLRNSC